MHTRYHISLDPGVRIFHMNHCVILRAGEGREGEGGGARCGTRLCDTCSLVYNIPSNSSIIIFAYTSPNKRTLVLSYTSLIMA